MRIAVLSDIHANLEALEAVLDDLGPSAVETVVCLGDLVGYGPDPDAVVSRVRQLGCLAIQGNHEAALMAKRERDRMNFQAQENNISTASLLSTDNLQYCCSLPRTLVLEDGLFVHGAPPDSVNTYVYMLSDEELARLLLPGTHRLYFTGHTHELKMVWCENGVVRRSEPEQGRSDLAGHGAVLFNCGSVGQPRDRDRCAKYLVWDSERCTVEVRAVDYDVETTMAKILARGFPPSFAERLR